MLGHRRGDDAGQRAHALEREVPIRLGAGGVIRPAGERRDREQPAGFEADVDARGLNRRAHEQRREHDEDDRGRGLTATRPARSRDESAEPPD